MPKTTTARPKADSDESIVAILESGQKGKFSEGSITGLHLYIDRGAPKWRLKFFPHGKEVLHSLGVYPDVSLDEARRLALGAKADAAQGVHPTEARKARQEAQRDLATMTFARMAEQWLERNSHLKPKTLAGHRGVLKNHLLPTLGKLHVGSIEVRHIRGMLSEIKDSPTMERCALRLLRAVLAYAMDHDYAEQNVAIGREGLLSKRVHKTQHHAALQTEPELLEYIRRLDALGGNADETGLSRTSSNDCTLAALWLLLLIPARPSELCAMTWSQIDLTKATWTYVVPKTSRQHTVYLSTQAIAQLNGIRDYSLALNKRAALSASPFGQFVEIEGEPGQDWVFPSTGTFGRHIASETLLRRLRNDLGYPAGALTGHGFRATFSSLSQEVLRTEFIVCEMCLGHKMPGQLAGTYVRTRLPEQQREAMQQWANYIEGLWREATAVYGDMDPGVRALIEQRTGRKMDWPAG